MKDKLVIRKSKNLLDSPFVWSWELRGKDGVYGSLETWAKALAAGLAEWRETFPSDFVGAKR